MYYAPENHKNNKTHTVNFIAMVFEPKTLYISHEVSIFYFKIWAGFAGGPNGNTEKKWANYEQLLRLVFSCF